MRKFLLSAIALWILMAPIRGWAQLPAPVTAPAGSTQAIEDIRKNYRIHVGPFYVNPAILLKELGVDTNVFNEAGQQKSDFTFTITPQAEVAVPFARRGLLKATVGSDAVYYARYRGERSLDPKAVVRVEGYARRFTVFVEESYLNSRQRWNHEIDLRSRHLQNDLFGGVAVRFTSKLSVEIARRHGRTRFDGDAFFLGQRLQETLNRNSDAWSAAVHHKFSSLTTLGVRYEKQQDRFPLSRVRDTDSFRVMSGGWLKPRALINGSAFVGYRSFRPKSGLITPYTGFVSQLALSYTLLGATTFGVSYDRDVHHSFEVTTPYFVDSSPGVFVRRALGGRLDVIVSAARHRYAYKALGATTAVDRVDVTDNYGANLGYRVTRQARVGFDVSHWTRTSAIDIRNYRGYRIRTTVTYGLGL